MQATKKIKEDGLSFVRILLSGYINEPIDKRLSSENPNFGIKLYDL